MGYRSLIVGDANVVRFWSASQIARPQLVGVPMKAVSCLDTLDSAMKEVSDELDYVIVSVLTGFIIDEATQGDVRESCVNIISLALKPILAAAKRAGRAEVSLSFLCHLMFDDL